MWTEPRGGGFGRATVRRVVPGHGATTGPVRVRDVRRLRGRAGHGARGLPTGLAAPTATHRLRRRRGVAATGRHATVHRPLATPRGAPEGAAVSPASRLRTAAIRRHRGAGRRLTRCPRQAAPG